MAIAFDAVTRSSDTTDTSLTFSHTVGSGSNRFLFVGGMLNTADLLTGVTYNGVSMTPVGAGKQQIPGDRWTYFYYLINPPTGAHDVVVNLSSSANIWTWTASSYSGVSQTAPEATSVTSGTDTGGKSQSVTTITDNAWLVGYLHAAVAVTAGTNTTERSNNSIYDTNTAQTPVGSHVLGLTWSDSHPWSYLIASIGIPVSNTSNFFF